MEKQKLLWIILSVTLLVLVVLASGLYLLKPTASVASTVSDNSSTGLQNIGFDSYEYIRGNSEPPGLEPSEKEGPKEIAIVVGEKKDTSEKETRKKTINSVTTDKTSAYKKPAVKKSVTKSSVVAKNKRGSKKTTAKKAPKTVKEYWIQAASYSSLSKAEWLRDELRRKGIASRIRTKVINGKTFYRVRIGPYVNKREAETFLSHLKAMKGLGNSYISVVYTKR